jgi:hypothetical protein
VHLSIKESYSYRLRKVSAAKKNLAKLKQLCGVNCEEYLDLKKAIGKK